MASDLIFVGQFVASKAGKTGLTVTVDIDRYTISDGSRSSLVTAGSATEGRRGLYHYRLAAADLSLYQYVATFIASDATVDQQEVAAIGLVVPDALVASRLAPTVAGRTLDVSAGGEAGVDWANVGTPGSTVALTNTQINSVLGSVGSIATDGISAAAVSAAAAAKIATAVIAGGAGTYSYSNTVDDGSGNLLDGVFVQCATDTGFTNIVSTATTNSLGAFTVYDDVAGTHYLRLQFSGITFADQTVTLA